MVAVCPSRLRTITSTGPSVAPLNTVAHTVSVVELTRVVVLTNISGPISTSTPATKLVPVMVTVTSVPSRPSSGEMSDAVGAGSGAGGLGAHGDDASHPIMVLVYWH